MIKKLLLILITLIVLINCVSAIDSSNWTTATVGYEEFKIPPQYENPYSSDFDLYEFDEDIDVFSIRYVNPRIMELYGYFIEHYSTMKKVKVSGHDGVFFSKFDRHDDKNKSILWFSSGEEFYYITWHGNKITPTIKEVIKSCSKSKYSHKEFYKILNEEYQNYKIINSIEDSQGYDYPSRDSGSHSFVSVGTNGVNFGVMN